MTRLAESSELYTQLQKVFDLPDRCIWMELRLGVGEIPTIRLEYYPPQPQPKIQISRSFRWCSDEFRRSMNRWLADRFGNELRSVEGKYHIVDSDLVDANRGRGGSNP